MGALPAVAGSAISFLLNAFFVWAALSLLTRRFPFRMVADDKFLAGAFSVYAVSILATALSGVRHVGLLESTLWTLQYFSPWFLMSRLRASPNLNYPFIFCLGASCGAIAGCLVGVFQVLAGNLRPEGGAGNPAIFGVACLLLGCFSALNITSAQLIVRKLATAGLLAGLLGMILSQTRGTWIAAIPALWLIYTYAPARWKQLYKRNCVIWLSAFALVATLITAELFWSRVQYTSTELEIMIADEGDFSTSIGERLKLWEASLPAVAASPIWGYGIQNRMLAIQFYYSSLGTSLAGFSHAHNLIVTAFLDGGLIVAIATIGLLASPIVIVSGPHRLREDRKRRCLATVLVCIYAVNGLSQITFKHDIMDGFFIYTALVIAASIRSNGYIQNS